MFTCASLIVLIAAFNGIESMVEKLYSEFDSNLTIRAKEGKSFDENTIDFKALKKIPEVKLYAKAIEEIVILKHEKKWVNATMLAVDSSFLEMAELSNHLIDGESFTYNKGENFALCGATLLDKLGAFIQKNDFESIIVYLPKRNARVSKLSNPFKTSIIKVAGRFNYNKEVNEESLVVDLNFGKSMLDYDSQITAVYVNCKEKSQLFELQEKLQKLVGSKFEVKTHYQKNELIYQTSKTEKIIVISILVFIFILAIFNLVASLTMLYIEKKDNIFTLKSLGASDRFIFRIFFYEGLLISFKGIFFGLILGLLVAGAQAYFYIIILPNSGGQAFPMWITFKDSLLVFGIVAIISILASYLTISILHKSQSKIYHG